MSAISPVVGERRHWPPQRLDVTAIACAKGWVWIMPDADGRPFSLPYARWLDLPMLDRAAGVVAQQSATADTSSPLPLIVGPIRVDLLRRVVSTTGGQRIRLTGAQFKLLAELAQAHGAVRSQSELTEAVLGRRWRFGDQSIKNLAFKLRQKLPRDDDGEWLVQTVRCAGYWVQAPVERPAP